MGRNRIPRKKGGVCPDPCGREAGRRGAQLKDQELWDVVAYVRSLAIPPYKGR